MYVRKKWLCEDCNRAWAKRSKELAGQEFTFAVNHDENIPTDPNQFKKIEATWIPPFQRFLKLFLPDTKHNFLKFRRPANHNVFPRSPRQLPKHIDFVFRNLGFYAPEGSSETDHWAQSRSFNSYALGTSLEFKHSATSNGLEHLMLCLIHEFTSHIHIKREHPDIQHYTHRDSNYGSIMLPVGHPEKDFTGHCKQDYTECLNGMVYSSEWLSNPEMKKLLQQINFGREPRLGFQLPISAKFKAVPQDETRRKLGSRDKSEIRKLGSRDNPPQGLGFVAAQYNFDIPLPLIDFQGTIEDLQSAGFNAEQTFNMSGGDSIKQIKSKAHPGFSAWMNENSTKVKFRVASEKTDEELLAFKRAIHDALGIKKNPPDNEVPEKEEIEGESLIAKLKKAKEHSDAGNYKEKKIILAALMKESPDDWIVDQPKGEDGSGNFPGIKHKSTNFQYHLPKNAIPQEIEVKGEKKDSTPTGGDKTKESEKTKKQGWRPYKGNTISALESEGILLSPHRIKTNPSTTDKGRLSLDGLMEPSVPLFRQAFGFPHKGQTIASFKIVDVQVDRKLRVKNMEYDFPWTIVAKVDGKPSKKTIEKTFDRFMKNREVLPGSLGTSYMVELGFDEYEITPAKRLYIVGKAKAKRILTNPAELDKDGQLYIKDFSPISDKAVSKKFRTEKLDGELPSDEFLRQIYSKCQLFGEAAGWVLPNGTMKWKRGHPLLNETRVDGFVVPDAISYWHTHPKAFEPSQTSPDDFCIYHGLFTNNGMCDFFTVMSDRIDHFVFAKSNRIDKEIVAESIMDFEDDVRNVFESAMEEYQTGLRPDEPLDTQKQTAHIVKKLNKLVPEFHCKFKCYKIDPNTILSHA